MPRCFAVAFLCLVSFPAQALTCRDVRQAVAQYGVDAVETWARWQGYSDKEIYQIRKVCRI